MAIIVASKGRKNSIFNHPKVRDAIEHFNPNDPEFIKALQKANKKSEAFFDDLRRKEREAEYQLASRRWIPIRERE